MNRFRIPLLAAGALMLLLAVAGIVVFSATFQTWLARRTLAAQPGWRGGIGSVSAGWGRVEVHDVQLERAGLRLQLPALQVDLPVVPAAWSGRFAVSRLVARGWTLDLSRPAGSPMDTRAAAGSPPSAPSAPVTDPAPPGRDSDAVTAARQMFAGVFRQLDLPVDLSLDGVVLEGEVILPEQRGRVQVNVTGGGLIADREGRFAVQAAAALADSAVSVVEIKGAVVAAMATPRSFGRFDFRLDASARGTRFPQGAGLRADLSASRTSTGETYTAAVVADGRDLLDLRAELPSGGPGLTGRWKTDMRDADLAPFSLGMPLPDFAVTGEGGFDADPAFAAVHVHGRLDATVDRWHVLRAELAAVGKLNVTADFDLTEQGGTLGVRKLDVALRGSSPIAEVRTLQAFDFAPATRELRTSDPGRELFGLGLQGVPVDWLRPWVSAVQVSGGRLRGGLTARAHEGGISLRSTSPLTVEDIGVFQSGRPLIRELNLALRAAADFTPQGWQTELSEAVASSGAADLLNLELKLGRLAGPGQAIKVAGRFSANLPALLAQPAAGGSLAVRSGRAEVEFAASLDGNRELQATVALKDLAAGTGPQAVPLPTLTTHLRADLARDGTVTFNAPCTLVRDGRTTDLTLVGTIGPEKNRTRAVEADISGTEVYWDDARIFGAAVTEKPAGANPAAPPWSGLHGSVALRLGRVIYSDTFEVKDVTGRLRLDAGILRLEGGQAGVGEGGRASVNGLVTFDATAQPAYGLIAVTMVGRRSRAGST
jgi:hypothetical protein